MMTAMEHRGPDANGSYINDQHGVYLGHRRLSIIDLNARSNQPFIDHSGRYVLVFNGQIYNFEAIKAEIHDYPFTTSSDTELVVAAYAKWGAGCLDKFNGMFALAIYDTMDQVLFIARDRIGVKPLYYYAGSDVFVFASELRALLASGLIPHLIDDAGLTQYLMFQATPCPDTMIKDVKQLKPAHYAYVRNGVVKETRYWNFGESSGKGHQDLAETLKTIRRLLLESVEMRMMSDVPLGAFLSGGIDSSAIVALMAQVSESVETFSIVFDDPRFDESIYSDIIAKKYQTQHHKLLLTPEHFLSELPHALNAMDSPSADGMNTYVVSKMTRQAGITVAMSGLGGDELFAGYDYFRTWTRMKNTGIYHLPRALRRLLAHWIGRNKDESRQERVVALLTSDGSITKTYPAFRQILGNQMINTLLSSGVQLRTSTGVKHDDTSNGFGLLSQFSIAELENYTLNVLLKDTDQFSMASSLEVREPFFDYRLVDYVVHVSDKWKKGATPKKLLVDAMGDLLPVEIVQRPKKGFTFPWASWLRGELRPIVEENLAYLADRREFNGTEVWRTWNDFQKDLSGHSWVYVWQLVALAHWLNRNLGRALN